MQSPLPPVIHSLRALAKILAKAEASCGPRRVAPETLLGDRLYPDMLPLTRQVQIACDHAKAIAARMTGIENPRFEDDETDFAGLQARIDRTVAFLETIPPEAFATADDREISFKAGPRELQMTGASYLGFYAIPNFYFHMTTAYNILRHDGVELGKVDFLGG